MIPEDTIRAYWKDPGHLAHYTDGKDLAHALQLRKEFVLSDREYLIVIMKKGKWITISESKGWEP